MKPYTPTIALLMAMVTGWASNALAEGAEASPPKQPAHTLNDPTRDLSDVSPGASRAGKRIPRCPQPCILLEGALPLAL